MKLGALCALPATLYNINNSNELQLLLKVINTAITVTLSYQQIKSSKAHNCSVPVFTNNVTKNWPFGQALNAIL